MARAGGRAGGSTALGPSRERLRAALGELVRAVDAADRRADGALLGTRGDGELALMLAQLTATLMRLVVLAYAEARALVQGEEAIATLHAELGAQARAGAALAARAGAWERVRAALRCLFAESVSLAGWASDAAVLGVLDGVLLGDDGARVRYEELDVEAIGGAYEGLIGLSLRAARGETLLLVPDDAAVDLETLLAARRSARAAKLEAIAGGVTGTRLGAALASAGTIGALREALARRASPWWPRVVPMGSLYLATGVARRRAGAHYTPRALTRPLVARALAPLVEGLDAARILELRICDPAMGSGAFLVEACRQLAARVTQADPSIDAATARSLVAERCLYGVDRDPLAVELARASLWLLAEAPRRPRALVDAHLRCGDALVGMGPADGAGRAAAEGVARATGGAAFHWAEELPEVLTSGRRGFDAFVGNPPWVAYAGRAAQPLPEALFDFYLRHYPSFHGYRTLHGLFIYRCASMLAEGGRLGLVVPTSVSDLGGYAPTRRAHDALCAVDDELPDFGDAFEGVFQPSMGLLSTRREAPTMVAPSSSPWRVARGDVDAASATLMERLAALPLLPPACFGERGFQTTGGDAAKLAIAARPAPPFVVPIREGGDVRAFRALPPRLHLDPSGLSGKLRADAAWREVRVLVRQTARFPIAALGDGTAFRNSILAGFAATPYGEHALVAYLNAAPVRWLHFMRFRDARQGMPQVKIAHLRSIPGVQGDAPAHLSALAQLGAALGGRNEGISGDEQRRLDETAADALGLSGSERDLVAAWAARHPAP